MKKFSTKTLVIALVGFLVVIGGVIVINNLSDQTPEQAVVSQSTTSQTDTDQTKAPATVAVDSTEAQLLFMIEEEKLAHDVYTVMYEKYGANVFGNILKSESTHQEKVLTLLEARNIADPRSSEVGVFKNQDLQKFYDQLIAQGSQSAAEAYKVGVAIEERDIADLTAQLAVITDEDVVVAYQSLRSASENHLRAFNRQL
jgi:hypothetical protein